MLFACLLFLTRSPSAGYRQLLALANIREPSQTKYSRIRRCFLKLNEISKFLLSWPNLTQSESDSKAADERPEKRAKVVERAIAKFADVLVTARSEIDDYFDEPA